MVKRYQHLIDSIRHDVVKHVSGLLWEADDESQAKDPPVSLLRHSKYGRAIDSVTLKCPTVSQLLCYSRSVQPESRHLYAYAISLGYLLFP
jgi:hypothetical protein